VASQASQTPKDKEPRTSHPFHESKNKRKETKGGKKKRKNRQTFHSTYIHLF
jgi:hypothetical protein